MRGRDEAVGWVALGAARGVGDVLARRLVGHFGGPWAALGADAAALAAVRCTPDLVAALARAREAEAEAAREVERTRALGARLIGCTDPEYPALLRDVHAAPLYLVARGVPLGDAPAIAVVGARRATPYGLEAARRLAGELAQAGLTVVSGLARGIDGAAHAGAVGVGGRTVAVLGSGIDVIYPAEHRPLADEIVEVGTLLSERPLGTPPRAEHFPARNRIIAGMTLGTLVVEAAEGSGSLITARLALEENREVFAVPGRIDSPLSAGTHRLIQEGARLVASVDDVVSEIAPALRTASRAASRVVPPALDRTTAALLEPLVAGPLAIDHLIRASGLDAAQVLARVLELELSGVLVQLPGKQVQLAPGAPARARSDARAQT